MFDENNILFSDNIEIIPSVEETVESNNQPEIIEPVENIGPIIVNKVNETVQPEKKIDFKVKRTVEKREERIVERRIDKRENSNIKNEIYKPSARQQSLYSVTSKMYVEKYNEYSNIPDFIVNEIFNIDDGKGTTTIEEAIIMLINLFPDTREKINSARYIEDAIKIGKKEIVKSLYKDCKAGFLNIPVHSRENLSKKITSDFENENLEASLYDYQLMRLSGYLRNV